MKRKLLNIKISVSALAIIIALPVLSACGVSLTDVTWEDYNDGEDSAIFHFSFDNGNIADKELPYESIVKNIEYMDVTGDGEDEVIVYREFVNNIHDNYILVDFFKIDEDTVTEISPSTDISELTGVAWDTEIVSNHTEEYTIVMKMKSYGKTAGILYMDEEMTIGYDKERWKVIEEQKIPDWELAYLDYLAANTDMNDSRMLLAFIDNDNVPELLLIEDNSHASGVKVYTYYQNSVIELGEFGSMGSMQYVEKGGMILSAFTGMGESDADFFQIENGEAKSVCSMMGYQPSDESPKSYEIDGVSVTEEAYLKKWQELYDIDEYAVIGYEDALTIRESEIVESLADAKDALFLQKD